MRDFLCVVPRHRSATCEQYFHGGEISQFRKGYAAWADTAGTIETPFVSVPGLVTGECVQRGEYSDLEVHVNADPGDARTDNIVGDVILDDEVSRPWGLHLVDMSLTMGNLLDIVGRQA